MEESYQQFIERIIETRGRHGCGEEYHEKHHIIPRCLGGEDCEENYIDLLAKEHYIAHKLLAKENPDIRKLQFAWWCMSSMKSKCTNERYRCTAEEYEEAKIARSKAMMGHEVSEESRKKISKNHADFKGEKHPQYGVHRSEEARRKLSKPVLCVETGIVYYSAKEAKRQTGIDSSHIGSCCKGYYKTCGGYHWKYYEEEKQEEK